MRTTWLLCLLPVLASTTFTSNPNNVASTGHTVITVSGGAFGSVDSSPTVALSTETCLSSSWLSATSLVCVSPPLRAAGTGSVSAMGSTSQNAVFIMDLPVVTQSAPFNVPLSGGSSVTLSGTSFGALDSTPTASTSLIGGEPLCTTSSWTSATAIACLAPSANDNLKNRAPLETFVRLEQVGSLPASRTFDAALSLSFSASLTSLLVSFEADTDFGGAANSTCDAYFTAATVTALGGGHATCRWDSPAQLVVHLGRHSTLALGAPVSFLPQFRVRFARDGLWSVPYSFPTPFTPLVPAVLPAVEVRLLAPAVVSTCDSPVLSVAASTGSGGRPWASVLWSLYTNASSVAAGVQATISAHLSSLARDAVRVDTWPQEFNASLPAGSYTFGVAMTNWAGSSATASFTLVVSPVLPFVQIDAPSVVSATTSTELSLTCTAHISACSADAAPLHYYWDIEAPLTLPFSVSRVSAVLVLPPFTFPPATRAVLSVRVEQPGVGNSTTSVVLTTRARPPSVSIASAIRTVGSGEAVLIDASSSRDLDFPTSAALVWAWSCSVLEPAANTATSCNLPSAPATTVLTLPASLVRTGALISVTLTATSSLTALSSTATAVVTVAASPPAIPQITLRWSDGTLPLPVRRSSSRCGFAVRINPHHTLGLLSTVAVPTGSVQSFSWSVQNSATNSAEVMSAALSPLTTSLLIIPGSALWHSQVYTFSLAATASTGGVGLASVDVVANEPPLATSDIIVIPSVGHALVTSFRLEAGDWTDPEFDEPLLFQYMLVAQDGSALPFTVPCSSPEIVAGLPAGDGDTNLLQIQVVVYDALGSFSTASQHLTVHPPDSASRALALITQQLSSCAADLQARQAERALRALFLASATLSFVSNSSASALQRDIVSKSVDTIALLTPSAAATSVAAGLLFRVLVSGAASLTSELDAASLSAVSNATQAVVETQLGREGSGDVLWGVGNVNTLLAAVTSELIRATATLSGWTATPTSRRLHSTAATTPLPESLFSAPLRGRLSARALLSTPTPTDAAHLRSASDTLLATISAQSRLSVASLTAGAPAVTVRAALFVVTTAVVHVPSLSGTGTYLCEPSAGAAGSAFLVHAQSVSSSLPAGTAHAEVMAARVDADVRAWLSHSTAGTSGPLVLLKLRAWKSPDAVPISTASRAVTVVQRVPASAVVLTNATQPGSVMADIAVHWTVSSQPAWDTDACTHGTVDTASRIFSVQCSGGSGEYSVHKLLVDCAGTVSGTAVADGCGVCGGSGVDVDSCGACRGGNAMCSGVGTCAPAGRPPSVPCTCPQYYAPPVCDRCISDHFGDGCAVYCKSAVTCNGHGSCDSLGTCVCVSNFVTRQGQQCSTCAVHWFGGFCELFCEPSQHCSGRGVCTSQGKCACFDNSRGSDCGTCRPPWYGASCDVWCDAAETCNGRGVCTSLGTCSCNATFSGANCEFCVTNHYGSDCSVYCDEGTCSGHGVCQLQTGACHCLYDTITGPACSLCTPNYYGFDCLVFCTAGTTCSGHGSCAVNGTCSCDANFVSVIPTNSPHCGVCAAGWYGATCMVPCLAGTTCSGHGSCSPTDGSCECLSVWAGPACSVCAPMQYSPTCEVFCDGATTCNGHGSCSSSTGQCVCSGNFGGSNCQSCTANWYGPSCNVPCTPQHTCSSKGVCSTAGTCVCEGNRGGVDCSGCKTNYYDNTCNTFCLVGSNCFGPDKYCDEAVGTCRCPGRRDGANCDLCVEGYYPFGSCTVRCQADLLRPDGCSGHGRCLADGSCECTAPHHGQYCDLCPLNYYGVNCDVYCDSTTCPAPKICDATESGKCKCAGHTTGPACDVCLPDYYSLDFSCNMYCLAATTCSAHGTCNIHTGACKCQSAFQGTNCGQCLANFYGPDCTKQCVDNWCSGHGRCGPSGDCICDAFFTGSTCVTCEAAHFGANCAVFCQAAVTCFGHGDCAAGEGSCTCHIGFTGTHCNQCAQFYFPLSGTAMCTIVCTGEATCNGHGSCSATGTCVCFPNWSAPACAACVPRQYGPACAVRCEAAVLCSGHGVCRTDGTCSCEPPFMGMRCADCLPHFFPAKVCSKYCERGNTCSGHGSCSLDGACLCEEHFTGDSCNECSFGFHGRQCDILCTLNTCNFRGVCSEFGVCQCNAPFSGATCFSCLPGLYGLECDVPCNAAIDCSQRGTCSSVGTCDCNAPFTGPSCDECAFGQYGTQCEHTCTDGKASPLGCSGHGQCRFEVSGPMCLCTGDFFGLNCEVQCNITVCGGALRSVGCTETGGCICIPPFVGVHCDECDVAFYGSSCTIFCNASSTCSGHGQCHTVTGQCECEARFSSRACDLCKSGYFSYPVCRACSRVGTCNGNGACDGNGYCVCDANFYGSACSTACSPSLCSNNGVCTLNGQCECGSHSFGSSCQTVLAPVASVSAVVSPEANEDVHSCVSAAKSACLLVPKGAVTSWTTFSINVYDATEASSLVAPPPTSHTIWASQVVAYGPKGVVFDPAVTVELSYSLPAEGRRRKMGLQYDLVVHFYDYDAATWRSLNTTVKDGSSVSALVSLLGTRFAVFAVPRSVPQTPPPTPPPTLAPIETTPTPTLPDVEIVRTPSPQFVLPNSLDGGLREADNSADLSRNLQMGLSIGIPVSLAGIGFLLYLGYRKIQQRHVLRSENLQLSAAPLNESIHVDVGVIPGDTLPSSSQGRVVI